MNEKDPLWDRALRRSADQLTKSDSCFLPHVIALSNSAGCFNSAYEYRSIPMDKHILFFTSTGNFPLFYLLLLKFFEPRPILSLYFGGRMKPLLYSLAYSHLLSFFFQLLSILKAIRKTQLLGRALFVEFLPLPLLSSVNSSGPKDYPY